MRRLILIATLAVALAGAVSACGGSSGAGAGATSAATTPAAGATATTGGAAIWEAECVGCHSADPAGVGVADAAQVRRVVEDGADGMPAFAGKLSAGDIKAVSDYVAAAAH